MIFIMFRNVENVGNVKNVENECERMWECEPAASRLLPPA
jgi:hypothetical protein